MTPTQNTYRAIILWLREKEDQVEETVHGVQSHTKIVVIRELLPYNADYMFCGLPHFCFCLILTAVQIGSANDGSLSNKWS